MDILPGDRFASLETSRMTILFFAISGLDVLGSLEKSLNEERKREIVDWIYSLQVETGFLGSTFLKIPKFEGKSSTCPVGVFSMRPNPPKCHIRRETTKNKY